MSFKKFKRNFDQICYVTRPVAELENYWMLIQRNHGRKVVINLIQYIRQRKIFRDRWVGALQNAPTPLCFINGKEDPISGNKMGIYFRKRVKNSELYPLEHIGHYPQVEAPDRVFAAALAFWQRNKLIR